MRLQTGRLEILDNSVVARDPHGQVGLANGVQYLDRQTGQERQALREKVIIVGASCVDSTRLLLNSKSERYPNGLGNGSDVIGRYLCEQIRLNVPGSSRSWSGTEDPERRGIGGEHIYMPRFNHRRRAQARLPSRLRRAVLEYGGEHLRAQPGRSEFPDSALH